MTKSLPASNKVMRNYLSELMTDNELANTSTSEEKQFDSPVDNEKLEKLLNKIAVAEPKTTVTTYKSEQNLKIPAKVKEQDVVKTPEIANVDNAPLATQKSQGGIKLKKVETFSRKSFQAMFFDVAGLIVAVPLVELGGIHNIGETTNLMGKPKWFKGIMLNRDEKINIVDTALWVMPEKCDAALINSLNYQYVIMLSDSKWGLTAEHLIDTVTLNENDVKWLDSPSKRPWLAGLVKDRMCALLDVDSLIKLLNEGENIHQK